MKLLTKSFLQLCFAANGGNVMATGITPTITGNNIATTKGFVYFGETSDAIFIERTGTNQLISFVDPTSVPLIANGYLYVKPIITYDVNNRTSTVSGVVYTSTNAADEGINLATITNSVITQVNSINPLGATQLQRGIIQLATQAEVNAGTITNKAIAPSTFAASTQLAAKAPLASPALTGTPTAPTAAVGTNTTQLATTAFVKNQGFQPNLGFTPVQQGGGTGQQANKLYMGWGTNSRIKVQVDSTDMGNLVTDAYLNNGTLPASFSALHANTGAIRITGAGDVNGYGFVATTPNGVYAPAGNSTFGGVSMGSAYVIGVTTTHGECYLSYGNGAPSGIVVFSNPGSQGSTCYIGSNNAGAGGYNGIVFGANQSRPWLNNLGTTNNSSSAIATLSDVIGVGQTWQDVTASRAIGVNYTNTTSKPIEVSIIMSLPASTTQVVLVVDSVGVSFYNNYANSVIVTQQAIVPPNSTYRLSVPAGSITSLTWNELR